MTPIRTQIGDVRAQGLVHAQRVVQQQPDHRR
jgi:hypothetical protein